MKISHNYYVRKQQGCCGAESMRGGMGVSWEKPEEVIIP